MKKTSLQEQTSHPNWQRKRLEILERDKWTCKQCGDTETTLTVHHKSYRMVDGKFVDYWDYDGEHLITLCNSCHAGEEVCLSRLSKESYYRMREFCDDSSAMEMMLCLMETMYCDFGRRIQMDDARALNTFITKLCMKAKKGQTLRSLLFEKKVVNNE